MRERPSRSIASTYSSSASAPVASLWPPVRRCADAAWKCVTSSRRRRRRSLGSPATGTAVLRSGLGSSSVPGRSSTTCARCSPSSTSLLGNSSVPHYPEPHPGTQPGNLRMRRSSPGNRDVSRFPGGIDEPIDQSTVTNPRFMLRCHRQAGRGFYRRAGACRRRGSNRDYRSAHESRARALCFESSGSKLPVGTRRVIVNLWSHREWS